MQGVVDYTRTTNPNGLFVEMMASRHPLRWRVRCTRCQSYWDADHRQIPYLTCRNSSCGRSPSETRSTLAQTGEAVTAVRSRDSDSAREYEREQSTQPVRWAEQPSQAGLRSADPDSIRHYLDYIEGR